MLRNSCPGRAGLPAQIHRITQSGQGDAPAEACPAAVPGASVRARETEDGAALEITTNGDVAMVRARSRVMATHHGISVEEHLRMHRDEDPAAAAHAPALLGGEPPGAGEPPAEKASVMARVSAEVEDIEAGARITFVPRGGARDEVTAVRTHVRRMAASMAEGRCPVMML